MVVDSDVPLVWWRISEVEAEGGRPPPQLAEQFGTAQTPDEDEPTQPAVVLAVDVVPPPLLGAH